jgi:hypothetical protein
MKCAAVVLLLCAVLPIGAFADEKASPIVEKQTSLWPKHRIVYHNLTILRYNPLGLEDRLDIVYRYRLYRKRGILWRDAHLGIGFTPSLSPAMSRIGATVFVQPLTILTLSASYYFISWYGIFDHLSSFESAHDDYSDTAIKRKGNKGLNYATNGHMVRLMAQVIGKIGPVAINNILNFYYGYMDLREGDSVYYEPRYDVLAPNDGWALTNESDLLYLTDFGLVAGVRNTVVHAFYRDEHVREGESTNTANVPMVRFGPFLAYIFDDKPKKKFIKPTLILIVNWWLKNRYRTGQDVSQAFPYMVLAFKFQGDLWSRDP